MWNIHWGRSESFFDYSPRLWLLLSAPQWIRNEKERNAIIKIRAYKLRMKCYFWPFVHRHSQCVEVESFGPVMIGKRPTAQPYRGGILTKTCKTNVSIINNTIKRTLPLTMHGTHSTEWSTQFDKNVVRATTACVSVCGRLSCEPKNKIDWARQRQQQWQEVHFGMHIIILCDEINNTHFAVSE